jgi:hypothetical protein
VECTPEFVAGNAVLGVGNQPNSGQPLIPAERAVLEDGPNLGRELATTVFVLTLPDATGLQE